MAQTVGQRIIRGVMAEENKEVTKEEKNQSEAAAQVSGPKEPQSPISEVSAAPAKKEATPLAAKTKPTNCADCNKPIRKKRWYYRNGKYYCSKRCFKDKVKKESKPEEPKTK